MNGLNRSRVLRGASALVIAMAAPAGCSAEPDSKRVEVARNVDTPAPTRQVSRTVRDGPLSAPGDAPVQQARAFAACAPEDAAAEYPAEQWQTAPARGWSEEGLERAWERARKGGYSAAMLVQHGRVISWFGDVDRPYESESMRKSLLSAVAGQLAAEGRLELDSTLGELGITERTPLNQLERQAKVRDLLMSRSGVYRRAAYSPPDQDEDRPRPGQYRPGEHFYYNNWDFNALGTIVEKAGGASIFELIRDRVAAPVGMQDYTLDDTRYVREEASLHPAYLIRLSTRDRARLGLLYLRNGCWKGRQVVPADWVRTSVSPLTSRTDELDFGYLWWSQEPPARHKLNGRIFMARGNPLQFVIAYPELDAVLVLTANRNFPGWVNWMRRKIGLTPEIEDYRETLNMVMGARRSGAGGA